MKRATLVEDLKSFPLFYLFLLSYTLVHAHFEYNFWVAGDAAVFVKYGAGDLLSVGERVYYTKAVWCFVLIWLLALRVPVKAAMAAAFLLYGVLLIALLPFRIYAGLNLLLAVGMTIEVVIRRRALWPRDDDVPGSRP